MTFRELEPLEKYPEPKFYLQDAPPGVICPHKVIMVFNGLETSIGLDMNKIGTYKEKEQKQILLDAKTVLIENALWKRGEVK